jgi:hypothetical protein
MTRISPLILALALGCGGVPGDPTGCPFVEIMQDAGCNYENTTATCRGGSLGADNGYDGFGVFTCKAGGPVVEVHTDAACYNSPGNEVYPMFDLNEGCPEVWGIKRWPN